jgi:hypothetical protein
MEPKAGRRAAFEAFPYNVRPISGPGDRVPPRKHNCVTLGTRSPIWPGAMLKTHLNNSRWPVRRCCELGGQD